jgi:hypothetical protein
MPILIGKIKTTMEIALIIPKSQSLRWRKSSKKSRKKNKVQEERRVLSKRSCQHKRKDSQDTKKLKRTNDLKTLIALKNCKNPNEVVKNPLIVE